MSRFLFVAPPFAGHVLPLASIGVELASRGHDVAWVSYDAARPWVPDGGAWFTVPPDPALESATGAARAPPPRFLAAEFAVFYRDVVVPMAVAMLPHVDAAVAAWRPDVLVIDQHALAGSLVARRRGLPWATSSPSSLLYGQALASHAPARRWLSGLFAAVQRDAGVDPVESPDVSPHLVLLFTSRGLAGEAGEFPAHYRFVGPALAHRRDPDGFPWEALRRRPRIIVSLGSVLAQHGERFFATLAAALRDQAVEVVVGAPDGVLRDAPPNFIVRAWLPQLSLLPHADACLSHGGSFAVESLANGVPLVLAPVWTDQFATARAIVAAGAGVRVRYGRVGADELRQAVHDVLFVPQYRAAARSAQAGLLAAGGTPAAADHVIALARAEPPAAGGS
ncbi:MAG: hypothetical protein IT517_14425 [Burkholderiales bacterium]|nr:hypothetical protein [Burkholderiales bacterium]